MSIIHSNLSYWEALETFELTTLDERRKVLCKNTLTKLMNQAIFSSSFTLSQRKYPQSKIFQKTKKTLEQE